MRFLLNGGKLYPLIEIRRDINCIFSPLSEVDSVPARYNSLLEILEARRITTANVLFFMDEMPSIQKVLPHAFIHRSDVRATTMQHCEEALKQEKNPTSLMYVTRYTLLDLVTSSFTLPIVGASTNVALAVLPENLPSPLTRENITAFTTLLYNF